MITAKQALDATKETILNGIEKYIHDAIEKGLYECEVIAFISEENKNILTERGFKLREKPTMLGNETVINWEE